MKHPPDAILDAVLYTVYSAAVTCRNWTLDDGVAREQINELMEAIHELPQMVRNWNGHDVEEILTHLRCFDAKKWRAKISSDQYSVPDFADLFQRCLDENSNGLGQV